MTDWLDWTSKKKKDEDKKIQTFQQRYRKFKHSWYHLGKERLLDTELELLTFHVLACQSPLFEVQHYNKIIFNQNSAYIMVNYFVI